VALEVLRRVEATQAYANLLLDAHLGRSRLSAADRALATELTYGVLRWQGRLDWILGQVLDRPIENLERTVRLTLRLGAYQACLLSRVPDFAVVDEAVELTRRRGRREAAGFVNAVLRAAIRWRDRGEVGPPEGSIEYWSSIGSHPRWLAERWLGRLGAVEAGALMAANNAVPPTTMVVNALRAEPAAVRAAVAGSVAALTPARYVAEALSVRGAGRIADLPGFREGWLVPMDEAGALPVLALDPQPGERVLDACAGGGGKSALLAARVGLRGEVVAVDSSPRAIRRLEAAKARLGLAMVRPRLGDCRAATGRGDRPFARVLLDAPCTGLGTLRRRPEIKWRRCPEDIPRASGLQDALLEGVAEAVAPGGVLVYSTCSLEPEETDEVAARFLAAHPEFQPDEVPSVGAEVRALAAGPGTLRAWPHRHGTDGFYILRLRRVS
jgi:16S rRNA (cytosine967-C5)-methyltransferase